MNTLDFINDEFTNKNVLIAPLNWGLGHATRCIPIIRSLLNKNCKVFVASDGDALLLLKKEFPQLQFLELPSYGITYTKNPFFFKFKMFYKSFSVLKIISEEKKIIENWISEFSVDILISDNRFGVHSSQIPSFYITHQVNVLSGITTKLTTNLHHKIIEKYTACWVPDFIESATTTSISGKLSKNKLKNTVYIGPLSRLEKQVLKQDIDVLVLLSGPEPQRTILEKKLILEFKNTEKKVFFVKGLVESVQKVDLLDNITFYNFATTPQISDLMNRCKLVICRSGYTTLMDLACMQKKAILIPTPGQTEQEYLGKRLDKLGFLPCVSQSDFSYKDLDIIVKYKGLPIW